jgi:hypothetical protein
MTKQYVAMAVAFTVAFCTGFGREEPKHEVNTRNAPQTETDILLAKLTEKFRTGRAWDEAMALAKLGDLRAIPTMIGVIDADNSSDTIYGVGYFGLGFGELGKLTGVRYSFYHDGAWWRRWWDASKSRFPQEVQNLPIPHLPKTENGEKYIPFPADIETFEGRAAHLRKMIRDGKLSALGLSGIGKAFADAGDPRAIPLLIGVIAADNSYPSVYGVGYFGLRKLTGVDYAESHDGAWWRQWWDANKMTYPAEAQASEIPDLSEEVAKGREVIESASRAEAEAELAEARYCKVNHVGVDVVSTNSSPETGG